MCRAFVIGFLIVASAPVFAAEPPAKAKINNKDSKAKVSQKADTKRKPAEVGVFSCEITVTDDNGAKQTTKQELNSTLKFTLPKTHEEFTLEAKEGSRVLTVNTYYQDPSKVYRLESIECDPYLNCEATRVTNTAQGQEKRPLTISPSGGAGIQALIGQRALFIYQLVSRGFHFYALKERMPNGELVGVGFTCELQ